MGTEMFPLHKNNPLIPNMAISPLKFHAMNLVPVPYITIFLGTAVNYGRMLKLWDGVVANRENVWKLKSVNNVMRR